MIIRWKGSTRVFDPRHAERARSLALPFGFARSSRNPGELIPRLFPAASIDTRANRSSATKQKRTSERFVAKKRFVLRVLDTIEGKKFIGRKIGEVGGLGGTIARGILRIRSYIFASKRTKFYRRPKRNTATIHRPDVIEDVSRGLLDKNRKITHDRRRFWKESYNELMSCRYPIEG